MKKILVPTDFSAQAEHALKLASEIAKKSNAEITILHVVEIPGQTSFNTMGQVSQADGMDGVFIIKMIEIGKKKLAKLQDHELLQGVNFKTELKAGNTYFNISSIINEYKPDMVIMGTSGSSGLDEILIGSNAEKVVRNATCPVLTLKEEISLSDINNIAFATSMKNDDKELVAKMKEIAQLSDAKIHLLKVNTPNSFESSTTTYARMTEYMENNGLEAERHIYNGINEEEGILDFAKENNIDLIVMGTHGRKGLMHLLSGSIAEDVVNHSKRPIMTLKIED